MKFDKNLFEEGEFLEEDGAESETEDGGLVFGNAGASGFDDGGSDLYADEYEDAIPEQDETSGKFRRPRKEVRWKNLLVILAFVAGVLICALIVFLIVRSPEKPVYDNTGRFYFASDLLTEEGKSFSVYDHIEFEVRNFADELRISDRAIESYSVTVRSGDDDITRDCKIKKDEESLISGTVAAGKVRIDLPEEYMNKPVEVCVTSTPENVVLNGTFTVIPSWSWSFTDQAGSVCGKLVILANEEITVKVVWDEKRLTADMSDPYIKAGRDGSSCVLSLAAGTSAEIYFFKEDVNSDLSSPGADAVKVEKTDGAAPSGTDAERFDIPTDTGENPGEIHENPEH